MNKLQHVLVDPKFAIQERDIKDFLGEFGPFNGRYVSRYPIDWKKRLLSHIDDLGLQPIQRKKILAKIYNEADLCTVQDPCKWDDQKSWGVNVEGIIPSRPDSIVVGDALDPAPFVNWLDALDDIRDSRRRSWPFNGSVSAYENACLPLLLNSPAAYLIDPYLDPFSSIVEKLIKSFFSKAKNSKCYSIELITRLNSCGASTRERNDPKIMTESEIYNQLSHIYGDVVPSNHYLKLHIVYEGGGELDLHDRFFLTMHGSINFGRGYSFRKGFENKVKTINAFVTDKAHHQQLKRTYIDGVARHSERLPKVPGVPYPNDVTTFTVVRNAQVQSN